MSARARHRGASSDHAARLSKFLAKRGKSLSPLLILTHDFPDPDALAAAHALGFLARELHGVQSTIAYGGVIGRTENRAMVELLKIPARRLRSDDLERHRSVALVDTQPRFENNSFPSDRRATIVIDQHRSKSPPSAELALVDTTCGATCVILAKALLDSPLRIPVKLATALAYGILADTLDLYRARRSDAVEVYLRLLPRCNMRTLARIRNPSRSRDFFVSLGSGIQDATVCRRLIVSHLRGVANPDLVSQAAEFLLTWERISWAFCTGRYRGRLHVSLRTSQTAVDAGEVLRDIAVDPNDAGGHGSIAGGAFLVGKDAAEAVWREQEQTLQRRLAKRLRLPSKTRFRRPFPSPAGRKVGR